MTRYTKIYTRPIFHCRAYGLLQLSLEHRKCFIFGLQLYTIYLKDLRSKSSEKHETLNQMETDKQSVSVNSALREARFCISFLSLFNCNFSILMSSASLASLTNWSRVSWRATFVLIRRLIVSDRCLRTST